MNEELLHIILKNFKGEVGDTDVLKIEEWKKASPENLELYQDYYKIWSKTGSLEYKIETNPDEAWLKFKQKTSHSPISKKRKINIVHILSSIAAIIVVLIGITGYFKHIREEKLIEVYSYNETKEIVLPDNSKVFLNINSKISYPEEFSQKTRKVFFEGEAFFEITKNPEKKFVINTKNSVTEVLGTSFNLRAITNENITEVAVFSGKVSFSFVTDQSKVILVKGEKGVLDIMKKKLIKMTVSDDRMYAWKDRRLFFSNDSLKNILPIIEWYFNVKIKVNSPELLDRTFTGQFDDPKLSEILDILCVTLNAEYSKEDKMILLSSK